MCSYSFDKKELTSRVLVTLRYLDSRGSRGALLGFFFFTKAKFTSKINIKRVRNLSENVGNGHFRDSNFQTFLGGMPPDPPFENPGSAPA